MLPAIHLSNATNAARLAIFAEAAYWHNEEQSFSFQRSFREEHRHGQVHWFTYGNAAGLVYGDTKRLIIGIAGSNDRHDWTNNFDILAEHIPSWAAVRKWEIDVSDDLYAPSGFCAHARLARDGADEILRRYFGTSIENDHRTLWLTGHSLGGAAATIVQLTEDYSRTRLYTFGSPRWLFRGTAPERIRTAVIRPSDPVTYVVPTYSAAKMAPIYVRYPGATRTSLSASLLVTSLCFGARAWAMLGLQALRKQPATFKIGHDIADYRRDLAPLR